MGVHAEVFLECDRCNTEVNDELKPDQTPEDYVDSEGWFFTGILLDRLLCGDCYDIEENETEEDDADDEESEPNAST